MVDAVALSIGNAEPIGDWTTLVATVSEWLDRSDLSDTQITEFIAVAEARLNRVLRVPQMETIATLTITTGNIDLPDDFLAMRAVHMDDRELRAMAPGSLISRYGTVAGLPMAYTLIGSSPRKLRAGPQPASDSDATIVYYAKLPAVSESNSDNWLLDEHPDIYLYGTLLAAEAFNSNDDRLATWKAAYDEALGELDRASQQDRYGGGPLVAGSAPAQVRGVRI